MFAFSSRAWAVASSALRLRQRRLERFGVDLIEEVALADERAFAEIHRLEEAFDARADVDVLESLRLADQIQVDGHVLLDDGRHVDFGRRRRDGGRLLARRGQRGRHRHGDKHRSSVGLHAHVPSAQSGAASQRHQQQPCPPARARRTAGRRRRRRGSTHATLYRSGETRTIGA